MLIFATLLASWLGLQAVHEAGHVAGAYLTGGRVQRVVLHPLTISRTDLAQNPRPLLVAWGGPVFGAAFPLLLWGLAAAGRLPEAFLLRFFAGACLVANGCYLGFGLIDRVGDCGDLLRAGAPPWHLVAFAAVAVPAGLWLWHGQARHFGLGPEAEPVRLRTVWLSVGALAALVALGLLRGAGK